MELAGIGEVDESSLYGDGDRFVRPCEFYKMESRPSPLAGVGDVLGSCLTYLCFLITPAATTSSG